MPCGSRYGVSVFRLERADPIPRAAIGRTIETVKGQAAGGAAKSDSAARQRPALRAFVPGGQVLLLLGGKFVELDAHGLELELGDLTVEVIGHRVDFGLESL